MSDKMLDVVRLAPPAPTISVTMPPFMLKAWFLVPALQFVKTTVEKEAEHIDARA